MTKKGTDIVAYITPIGWIIAYVFGAREQSKFHLNQSLVILLAGVVLKIINYFPLMWLVTWIIAVVLFIFWLIGIINAIQGVEKPLPLIKEIQILN